MTLAPEAREVVSLLQPPLPSPGDNSIRVEVDDRHEGEVHAPNANNHCNYYSRGGQSATVFISRSLDYDAVERVFHADNGAFTAAMAVGAPDATSDRGVTNPRPGCPTPGAVGRRTGWNSIMPTPQICESNSRLQHPVSRIVGVHYADWNFGNKYGNDSDVIRQQVLQFQFG